MRKLLETTDNFDDAVSAHAQLIISVIKDESVPARMHTFYLYQDFSSSETLENKDVILTSRYNRNDLDGFTSSLHRMHYIRSRVYAQMSDERTLKYFNKIIFG